MYITIIRFTGSLPVSMCLISSIWIAIFPKH